MTQSRAIELTVEVVDNFTAPLRALRDRLGFRNDAPPEPAGETPRLAHGFRWSDLTNEIEAERQGAE